MSQSLVIIGALELALEFTKLFRESQHLVLLTDGGEESLPANCTIATSVENIPSDARAIFYADHVLDEDILEELDESATGKPLFVNALCHTATECAVVVGHENVFGFAFLPGNTASAEVLEVSYALQSHPLQQKGAIELLTGILNRQIEIVADRKGLVSSRILSMVINEAAFALMEGVAGPSDIDIAMKLGTNYPEGPLRWVDKIGAQYIVDILDALHEEYQEERYRVCVLLRQMAHAERPFHAQPA